MAYTADARVIEDNIVSLLRNKDQRGMELFYDRYSTTLYGFLFRTLQSDELAEEALMEVCLRVWRSIEVFDPDKERLLTWAINMARQNAVSKIKSADTTGKVTAYDELNNVHYDPESVLTRELINKLDDNQKTAIEGMYFFDYSYKTISEKLNIEAADLKKNIRSVLKMLQATQTHLK